MSPHDLKQLEVRRGKLQAEYKTALSELTDVREKLQRIERTMRSLEEQIAHSKTQPVVSEHAILRYAERVMGLDISEVQKQIMTPSILRAIETLGSGKIPLANGVVAIVKDKVVVSIVPA